MSSFSAYLEASKFSPLQLWLRLNVQDHGFLSFGIVLGLIILYAAHYFSSPYRKLPPGPRGYPIIGSLLELRKEQWLKFAAWRKDYGRFTEYILSWLISEVGLDRRSHLPQGSWPVDNRPQLA